MPTKTTITNYLDNLPRISDLNIGDMFFFYTYQHEGVRMVIKGGQGTEVRAVKITKHPGAVWTYSATPYLRCVPVDSLDMSYAHALAKWKKENDPVLTFGDLKAGDLYCYGGKPHGTSAIHMKCCTGSNMPRAVTVLSSGSPSMRSGTAQATPDVQRVTKVTLEQAQQQQQ